jgi:transcriptional regulator
VSNRERAEVLQGTLDVMILQTIAALGPSHGYAMAARIEQVSAGRVRLNMGTLYPGLMRLEQRGFVRGTWGVTENNRKARFYALTPAGKKQLAAEKREWSRMVTTMQAILNEPI